MVGLTVAATGSLFEQVINSGPASLVLGGVGILGTVGSAIWYVVKFQAAFTTKLEESDKKKDRRISDLETRVAGAEKSERRCQWRLAEMGRQLVEAGIDYHEPDLPSWLAEDDRVDLEKHEPETEDDEQAAP